MTGTRRVIIKRTKNIKADSSYIKRYIRTYIDEKGKYSYPRGEISDSNLTEEERKKLRLSSKGIVFTGGFFGEDIIDEKITSENKRKKKIFDFVNKWMFYQRKINKEMEHAYRIVLSMSPVCYEQLREFGIQPEFALKRIWECAIKEFLKNEEGAWIAGCHLDKKHPHLHIILFPYTSRFEKIQLNYQSEEKNPMLELIAISNLEAEKFWREYLPLRYQNPDTAKALLQAKPEEDVPLPDLKTFYREDNSLLPQNQKRITQSSFISYKWEKPESSTPSYPIPEKSSISIIQKAFKKISNFWKEFREAIENKSLQNIENKISENLIMDNDEEKNLLRKAKEEFEQAKNIQINKKKFMSLLISYLENYIFVWKNKREREREFLKVGQNFTEPIKCIFYAIRARIMEAIMIFAKIKESPDHYEEIDYENKKLPSLQRIKARLLRTNNIQNFR